MPEELKARTLKVEDLIEYQEGSVVSREIIRKDTGTVTVFAFDKGERIERTYCTFRCHGSGNRREGRDHYFRE